PVENPVLNAVRCGLEMVSAAGRLTAGGNVRGGIHVGPVMAGGGGNRQKPFGLWGGTVKTPARGGSQGPGRGRNVSRPAWERVADRCRGGSLGRIPLKGRGEIEIFRVDGLLSSWQPG